MKIVNAALNIANINAATSAAGSNILSSYAGFDWQSALFFDIETTGLNHRCSHLYLIGALWLTDGTFCLRQWFAEKPGDEKDILQDFLHFASDFTRLVHYNGSSFDLPYLMRKCIFYGLDPAPLQAESCDLYSRFRPLKPWLNAENILCETPNGDTVYPKGMKLKTMEQVVGLQRRDNYSGKELIKLYKKWLQNGDTDLLDVLLLHNHEDVTGMVHIQCLFVLLALQNGTLPLSLDSHEDKPDSLTLWLTPAETIPISLTTEMNHIHLSVKPDRITLRLPKLHGELRLYFSDYRNYYYLPREDRAIHKSVAIYTDPAFRQKATPDTCYERHTGIFLPQNGDSFTPVFRKNRGDKTSYFLYDNKMLKNRNELSTCAAQMIQTLLS